MARADFMLAVDALSQVRRICQLVDGLPLGIALAAAWVRRRSLAQIIASIEQSLDFLSTRLRDVDPRHRSMRAVFEASWQMLDGEEQAILAALAVFPASFTVEAAAQVATANLFDLDLLCEKSLLQQQQEQERYSLHSLVRHFARAKLGSREVIIEHAFVEYYFRFARKHHDDYAALQPEWHNFGAAIHTAHVQATWQRVLDFVSLLDEPWFRQGRFPDMRAGLTMALDTARIVGDEDVLAQTLLRSGAVALELSEYREAEAHLDNALALFTHLEEGLGIAHAKYFLGRMKNEQAADDEALALFAESKRIFEAECAPLGVARNLNLIAVCLIKKGHDFQGARAHLEQSIKLQQELPLSPIYLESLRYLARTKARADNFSAAADHLTAAAQLSLQQNNIGEYAAILYERMILYKRQNRIHEALTVGHECLENFKSLGSLRWEALIKTQLGLFYQAKQEHEQALAALQEGLQLFCELDDQYEQAYSHYYLHQLYKQIGDEIQSLAAMQDAIRINRQLNDPYLSNLLSKAP